MKIIFQDDDGTALREVVLSVEETAAMETDMVDIIEWIENAVREKARRRMDHIVTMSGLGSKHTPEAAKKAVIASLKAEAHPLMETAKQRAEKSKTARLTKER